MSVVPDLPGDCRSTLNDRIESFALVSYIPDPLAGFLNRLRREFVPTCFLQAHVTILPPRQLPGSAEQAWQQVRDASSKFQPFEIELGDVEVFPGTNVIYIGLRKGTSSMKRMHDALNEAGLLFKEPFCYHPHITLAQEIPVDRVPEMTEHAKRRWREFAHSRSFQVETITFVQNTRRNVWIDLGECHLGSRKAELLEPILV